MGIDPLIVRGVFIVLTVFAGIGVLLYGLAWALLPEPDGRIHVQEAGAGRWTSRHDRRPDHHRSSASPAWAAVLGLGPPRLRRFFWALFWVGGVIYLIYFLTQRNKTRERSTPMTSPPAAGGPVTAAYGYQRLPPAATAAGSLHAAATPAVTAQPGARHCGDFHAAVRPGRPGPSAPTPAAAAPGAIRPAGPHQSGSRTRAAATRGPGAPAVAVTAGLALLVGGSIKALDAGNVIDLGDSANAVVWASRRRRPGPGILLAGLRGKTSGILGFFAVVALIVGGDLQRGAER